MPSISLCMIVRNEEQTLPRCLDSVRDLVNEIILVDTGSTDATRTLALRYNARLFDFTWIDDFSAARNEALRHATGDWILSLDADDWIDEPNRLLLRKLFASLPDANLAYNFHYLSNHGTTQPPTTGEQTRLFRNDPRIRWSGRVHEQIIPDVLRSGGQLLHSNIAIHHTGYADPALMHQKNLRNLALLRLDIAEHPDNLFTSFNIGWTLTALGQTAEALPILQSTADQCPALNPPVKESWVCMLHILLARARRKFNQFHECLETCRRGLALFPNDADLLFNESVALFMLGNLPTAAQRMEFLLAANPPTYFPVGRQDGITGYVTRHNLAVLHLMQNRPADAEAQWRRALDEKPTHKDALLGLAQLLAPQHRFPESEQLLQRLESLPDGKLPANLQRASNLLAQKNFPAAQHLLEQIIQQNPTPLYPKILLSRALLYSANYPAAAALLDTILALPPTPDERPLHAEAQQNRTLLKSRYNI